MDPEVRSPAELYERYAGPVFTYLLRLSGDRGLAEDLAGETFYRAMLALDGFRAECSIRTWLLRIAHNLYLRNIKRARRTTSLEGLAERGVTFGAAQAGPESVLLRNERSRAIRRAFLSLGEGDRSILLLAAQGDLSCRQIAEVLGISLTAAKVRLYRARRRLVAVLGADPRHSPMGSEQMEEDGHAEL